MKKALEMALEALENHCGNYKLDDEGVKRFVAACNAIKEALAPTSTQCEVQPEQEPVGEVNRYGLDSHGRQWHGIYWYDANVDVPHGTKLYTTPPKRPSEQEPVAYYHPQLGFYWTKPTKITAPTIVDVEPLPLYTAPPKPEQEPEPDALTVVYMSGVFEGKKLEREACAKVCEGMAYVDAQPHHYAAAIRARGNT